MPPKKVAVRRIGSVVFGRPARFIIDNRWSFVRVGGRLVRAWVDRVGFEQENVSLRPHLLLSLIAAENLSSFWDYLTLMLADMVSYDAALIWTDGLNEGRRAILLGATCAECSVPVASGNKPLNAAVCSPNCELPAALVQSGRLAPAIQQRRPFSEGSISIVLVLVDHPLAVLTLCRGRRESEIKRDALDKLERISPFIAAALSRLLSQQRQVAVNAMALRHLQESPVGLILLDDSLRTNFVNKQGYRMAEFWSQGTMRGVARRQQEFRVPHDLLDACRKLLEESEASRDRQEAWERAERVFNNNDENMQATVRIKSGPGVYYSGLLVQFDYLASPDYETFAPNEGQLGILARLSHAERRVAILAAGGLGNAQIASQLCIHRSTVKDHLSHIYRKLNINGRTYLARLLSQSAENRHEASQEA